MYQMMGLCIVLMAVACAAGQAQQQGGQIQNQQQQTIQQLQAQVQQLQQQIAELRKHDQLDSEYLMLLSDSELAALAALKEARSLQEADRIELLIQVLEQSAHSQIVRNAAFLMLIDVLHAQDRGKEAAQLIERMMDENSRARHSRPGTQRPDYRVPLGQRVDPEEYQSPGQRLEPYTPYLPRYYYHDYRFRDPRDGDRRLELDLDLPYGLGRSYGDPTGRRLELELRSPSIYRGRPNEYHRYFYERHYGSPWRYYRDPFDRPWFDNPRWRRWWWH